MPETLKMPARPKGPKVRETRVFTEQTAALYKKAGDLAVKGGQLVTGYCDGRVWGQHWTDSRGDIVVNCYMRIEDGVSSDAGVDVSVGGKLVFDAKTATNAVDGGVEIIQSTNVYVPGDWEKAFLKLRPRRSKKEA